MRRYVLVAPNDDEEHDVDAAVLHLVDASFPQLEEMAREVQVRPDIDFAETMHSFLAANLSTLAETVLRAENSAAFGTQFRTRGNAFLTRLVALCLRCSTDGNASLERVVRNRLEAISGDVGNTVREWILSAAVGHLRNYVARVDRQSPTNNEDIEQYVVHSGSDAEQRQGARRRRLLQYQAREDETFVTPRSSPPRQNPDPMETDEASNEPLQPNVDVPKKSEEASVDSPPRQLPDAEQRFPQSVSLFGISNLFLKCLNTYYILVIGPKRCRFNNCHWQPTLARYFAVKLGANRQPRRHSSKQSRASKAVQRCILDHSIRQTSPIVIQTQTFRCRRRGHFRCDIGRHQCHWNSAFNLRQ